jgi:hypothetical protein
MTLSDAHKHDSIYYGDRPEWIIILEITRDSNLLERMNFEVATDRLSKFEDDYAIERSGHWAVGWIDRLVVRPESEALNIGYEIQDKLTDYLILDEELYYELLTETFIALWDNSSLSERIGYLIENDESIFAARCSAYDLYERAPNTYERVQSWAEGS